MPREKKPQNEIRKTHVSCVLTAEEKRAFERRCDNHGYPTNNPHAITNIIYWRIMTTCPSSGYWHVA